MATTARRIVLAALAIAMVTACTAQAQAQIRFRLRSPIRLAPPVVVSQPVYSTPVYSTPVYSTPVISQPIPYLGFDSFFDGSGEQITAVQHGSAAWRVGLEPGDKVLAVNGIYLRYHGHGLQLLQQAAAYRGHVTLSVRDVHTGLVVNRTIGLGTSSVAVSSSSSYAVYPNLRPSTILRRLPR